MQSVIPQHNYCFDNESWFFPPEPSPINSRAANGGKNYCFKKVKALNAAQLCAPFLQFNLGNKRRQIVLPNISQRLSVGN